MTKWFEGIKSRFNSTQPICEMLRKLNPLDAKFLYKCYNGKPFQKFSISGLRIWEMDLFWCIIQFRLVLLLFT